MKWLAIVDFERVSCTFTLFCFLFQTVYDPFFISTYNLFYTSLPVLCLGIMDQDVDDYYSRRFPKLYTPGHYNLFFNKRVFMWSAIHGAVTSFLILFVPYGECWWLVSVHHISHCSVHPTSITILFTLVFYFSHLDLFIHTCKDLRNVIKYCNKSCSCYLKDVCVCEIHDTYQTRCVHKIVSTQHKATVQTMLLFTILGHTIFILEWSDWK